MSDTGSDPAKTQLEERIERLKLLTQVLVTITALLALATAGLGLFTKNQSDAKQQAQTQASGLSGTVDTLQKQNNALKTENTSLRSENDGLKKQLAEAGSPTGSSVPTDPGTPVQQVLGTDIKASSTTGNEWHLDGPGSINGKAYDQVVSMGWCSGCLDSGTTAGYAEFDLGSRSLGTLQTTIGQSDRSAQSTGRFRFDIQLDGVNRFSRVLPFGTSVPVDLPLNNALRVRFVVTLVGDKVNAVTAFGNPTVAP